MKRMVKTKSLTIEFPRVWKWKWRMYRIYDKK
jgi:hypothetical protein